MNDDSQKAQQIQTNWIVITGGPSSGKTTTVNHIKSLGFHGSPEAARILMDFGLQSGLTIDEVRRSEQQMNKSILSTHLAFEDILLAERLCFKDRGIPDSLAYIRLTGGDEEFAKKSSQKRRYKAIFQLDLLPFKTDNIRTEDLEGAKRIDELIHQSYTELGYQVTRIPAVSVRERSKIILGSLGLSQKSEVI